MTDQTKFRLNEISKIESILTKKLIKGKSCTKKLSKYAAAFDYLDENLILLSATSGRACIISPGSVVWAAVGI